MLSVVLLVVEELLNFGMEVGQPLLLLSVRVVHCHVSTRGDDVELRVKHINTVHHTVQTRHGEGIVGLVLSNGVLAVKFKRNKEDIELFPIDNFNFITIRRNSLTIYVVPSGNFLEGTGDNEVGVVHGNEISGELAREVVLGVKLLPVDVRVGVLGLLQGMCNGALGHTQFVGQQCRNQIAVTVVANDEVRLGLHLGSNFHSNILPNISYITVRAL